MAGLQAELVETDAAALGSAALTTARHRCLIVLLTDLNPRGERGAAAPAAVAGGKARGGGRRGGGSGARSDVRGPERCRRGVRRGSRAAGAGRAQAGLRALQRRGAHVVDAPPERLPAALADAYLGLKAAGRSDRGRWVP